MAVCVLFDRMNGSYENLKGGSSSEAMEDFSGGVTEMFDLTQNPPPNLFTIMTKAVERESMMGCSVDVSHIHYRIHGTTVDTLQFTNEFYSELNIALQNKINST